METIIWAVLTVLVTLTGGTPTGGASASTDNHFSEYNVDFTGPSCPVGTQECRASFIIDNEFGTYELYIGN